MANTYLVLTGCSTFTVFEFIPTGMDTQLGATIFIIKTRNGELEL